VAVDSKHSDQRRSPDRVPLSAFVPTSVRDGLQQLAVAHERTLSAEIRVALRSHLETCSPEPIAADAAS
jgi:hypothetical protein